MKILKKKIKKKMKIQKQNRCVGKIQTFENFEKNENFEKKY